MDQTRRTPKRPMEQLLRTSEDMVGELDIDIRVIKISKDNFHARSERCTATCHSCASCNCR